MSASWLRALAASRGVADVRDRLAAGERVRLAGLGGSARLVLAALATQRPLLVVVSRERDVESVTGDLALLLSEAGETGRALPFPAPGPPPFRGLPRHPDAELRRATVLHAAARDRVRAVVASPHGLLRPCLARQAFETRCLTLREGEEMTPEILLEALDEAGYRHEDPVSSPGQVARRGGIVDLFPPDREAPVRIEFLGDTIDTLRRFDPETQRSQGPIGEFEIAPLSDAFATHSVMRTLRDRLAERFAGRRELDGLLDRLARGLAEELPELLPLVPGAVVPAWEHLPDAVPVVLEPEAVAQEAAAFAERCREDRRQRPEGLLPEPEEALVAEQALGARLETRPALHLREIDPGGDSLQLSSRPVPRYAGDLRRLSADLAGAAGPRVLYLGNAGRADRLADVLREDGLAIGDAVEIRVGALSQGFEWPQAGLAVLADGDVFPEEVHLHPRDRGRRTRSFLSDFRDLRIGDLVVHQDHGIGRFEGLETLAVAGQQREFMVLGYQAGDKLKVPIESFDRVQKYASAEGARPKVDRLGSGTWERTKKRVRRAMRDMADELLRLYAERKARPGHAFTAHSPWQREFEEAFEYEETEDQHAAIRDVASDMADPSPMDRLICGDVGYGKTEVAMRAAMRAVLDGKQVAVLAPTTVLAFQHWKTFQKRFAPFPVRVEMASRFRSPRQVRATLEAVAAGQVDVLIGTHRLLSKDVAFRDLGLLVVDEEQRFGVAAKERLKKLSAGIDCLTLSATPIPRTLQMGLMGIRDMSVIETPPKDRLAIQTSIVKFSTDVVVAAIRQELSRDGQVYVVHNRVGSIYSLASLVQAQVPEARVVVAHGQLPEGQLEKAMLAFVEGRADVLVATTIIENGLDIPRANTLVVNRADRFGLAELYQLRGRVGRSDRRAFAYLLVPPDRALSEIARKRLAAIREFSELGAGFRIAALDLELRGAGNLLGGEQSGHIEAVGLDLYVKLLEQTVLELKGAAPRETARAAVNLGLELRIPEEYVPDVHQRMSLYKRLSQAASLSEVDALRRELRERYGPLPLEVERLLAYGAARLRADGLGIVKVERGPGVLRLQLDADTKASGDVLVRLVQATPGATLAPDGALRLPVAAHAEPLVAFEAVLGALESACAPTAVRP